MNKNLIALAVAAALTVPMIAQAEVKVSGAVQGEIGSMKQGTGDRQTVTGGPLGALSAAGGPNKIRFDVSEKLGGGLTGFARFDWSYDTFQDRGSSGSNFNNREKYVGIKGSMAHFKMGRIQGVYKTSTLGYDRWAATGLQARKTGGGMSAGAFGHNSFIDDVLEAGVKFGGFKATIQGIIDESVNAKGVSRKNSYLGELKYGMKNWEIAAVGSRQRDDVADLSLTNWKVGGKYTLGGLYLALQYESVEDNDNAMGLMTKGSVGVDGEVEAADFMWGSIGYRMGNVELNGWVAGLKADTLNAAGMLTTADATSYAVGVKYHFSKNMQVYAGWRDTDSEIDAFDEQALLGGMRLGF